MSTHSSFTVTNGDLILTLNPAEEGGYVVTSPDYSQLVTEAESLEEAFANAYDALAALAESDRNARTRSAAQMASSVMSLPVDERIRLAQQLWDSIEEESPNSSSPITPELLAEIRRRDAELDSGMVASVSHEDVMRAARRAIGCE